MKKIVVYGSLFSIFITLMIPVIPAAQYQSVQNTIQEQIQSMIQIKSDSSNNQDGLDIEIEPLLIRVVGLIVLVLRKHIKNSLGFFGRILFRIILIIVFCSYSIFLSLSKSNSLVETLLRLVISFFYALWLPFLSKAEFLNLLIFANEGIGPFSKLFVFLRTYAFYNDN